MLTALVVLILGAMLLLAVAGGRRFPLVNKVVATVLLPVENGINALLHGGDNVREFWRALTTLRLKNKELLLENQKLKQEYVNMSALQRENEHLRQLLNYKVEHKSQKVVAAKIIAKDFGDLRDTVYINAGNAQGVNNDMAVITENGLVGIIDETYEEYSRVLLVTSPNCRVGARVVASDYDSSGVVRGIHETQEYLVMEHIPRKAKIQEGDLVVTNGYSGKHPENIYIGKLVNVQMDAAGLLQEADLQLMEDVVGLESVLVVVDFSPKLQVTAKGGRTR